MEVVWVIQNLIEHHYGNTLVYITWVTIIPNRMIAISSESACMLGILPFSHVLVLFVIKINFVPPGNKKIECNSSKKTGEAAVVGTEHDLRT